MKKFAFLLSLVAVLAMSGCAFADRGDIISLDRYTSAIGGGKDLVNSATGTSDDQGNWASEVYYYGTVEELLIGTDTRFDGGTLSTDVQTTYAQIEGYGPIERMSSPAFQGSDAGLGNKKTTGVTRYLSRSSKKMVRRLSRSSGG